MPLTCAAQERMSNQSNPSAVEQPNSDTGSDEEQDRLLDGLLGSVRRDVSLDRAMQPTQRVQMAEEDIRGGLTGNGGLGNDDMLLRATLCHELPSVRSAPLAEFRQMYPAPKGDEVVFTTEAHNGLQSARSAPLAGSCRVQRAPRGDEVVFTTEPRADYRV